MLNHDSLQWSQTAATFRSLGQYEPQATAKARSFMAGVVQSVKMPKIARQVCQAILMGGIEPISNHFLPWNQGKIRYEGVTFSRILAGTLVAVKEYRRYLSSFPPTQEIFRDERIALKLLQHTRNIVSAISSLFSPYIPTSSTQFLHIWLLSYRHWKQK